MIQKALALSSFEFGPEFAEIFEKFEKSKKKLSIDNLYNFFFNPVVVLYTW